MIERKTTCLQFPVSSAVAQVLAVEDNPDLASLMRRALESKGVEVTIAGSGAQALELVGQRRFDLILVNNRLPDASGVEVCRRLKLDSAMKTVPVIFVSGETHPGAMVNAFLAGAADYLIKPIGIEYLQDRVLAQIATR